MRNDCIGAVAQAFGRSITQQEAQAIKARIKEGMKQLARQDPATWRTMGRDARLRLAARHAGDSLLAEAGKRKQRLALTALAHDKVMKRYHNLGLVRKLKLADKKGALDSVARHLGMFNDKLSINHSFAGLSDEELDERIR
jgi:hypothetical protein